MPQRFDIVLCTLNARYPHASLGLRYLLANLGALRARTVLEEFVIHDRPTDVVERILKHQPVIVGLGVYVWNATESLEVVRLLKQVAPQVRVVLGGPEVRFEQHTQPICALADDVLAGEADHAFRELCEAILAGAPPGGLKQVVAPSLDTVELPFAEFSPRDLETRVLYVEASRGCPYHCEFCLSSRDDGVRRFDTSRFLNALEGLFERGARQFKFVDRTFNLDLAVTQAILEFFLARPGTFAHFELVPDRLPARLRELLTRFPPGALQFELGIQTWDPQVAARISRRQDFTATEDNLRFLRTHTKVHLHCDLIVGLPGETAAGFGRGFDRLLALEPHEIQVGLLKRLHGAPIARHDTEWRQVYSERAPYEVVRTSHLDFFELQQLKRFARAWDLTSNSGRYPALTRRLLGLRASPFEAFTEWTQWLHLEIGDFTNVSPSKMSSLLSRFLTAHQVPDVAALAAEDEAHRAQVSRREGLERQAAHG